MKASGEGEAPAEPRTFRVAGTIRDLGRFDLPNACLTACGLPVLTPDLLLRLRRRKS